MTETQRRRYDPFAWVVLAVIAAIAIYGGVGTYYNQKADHRQDVAAIAAGKRQAADNKANAVTNCENANETREASRNLWHFVIDLTTASNPHATDVQKTFVAEFRAYVDTVYQPHDCTDLSKKYKLPPTPVIPVVPAS